MTVLECACGATQFYRVVIAPRMEPVRPNADWTMPLEAAFLMGHQCAACGRLVPDAPHAVPIPEEASHAPES
jgi:hypothetical protein